MKSPADPLTVYSALMDSLIRDIYAGTHGHNRWCAEAFVELDLAYAHRRLKNEGLRFLTDALPTLGKALDRALETSHLNVASSFSKVNNTSIPRFLQGKFRCIFRPDGTLLDSPDPYSIQELRQVLFFFYKLALPFTDEQKEKSLNQFLQAESDLSDFSPGCCDERIVTRAQDLLSRLFRGYDPKEIIPGHGPGSVNTGEKGNEKWRFSRLYNRIHQCYPYYDYFVVNRKEEILDRVSWYRSLLRVEDSFSKVCLVPKDSRGPRVISVEPLETQYIQQGQMRSIVRLVEKHPLTKGFVNFTDQTINARLALESSLTREHATLDLKEASDRVHCNVVRVLFPELLCRYLFATRSSGTVLPDGSTIEFRKFAPMGSANCFPILALTIWSIIRAYFDVNRIHGDVYVYGDDVIVPTSTANGVSELLKTFGLKVNTEKSYVEGFFRESCGTDAYLGVDITPLRLRKPWSRKSSDYSLFAHLTSLLANMHNRGYWRTASTIQVFLESLFRRIPYGTKTSGFPCIPVDSPRLAERLNILQGFRFKWDCDTQRYLFYVLADKSVKTKSEISEWPRLLKGILSPSYGRDPSLVDFRQASRKLAFRWVSIN